MKVPPIEIKMFKEVPNYPSAILVMKCSCGFQHEFSIIDITKGFYVHMPCHVCGKKIVGGAA